MNWGFGCLRRQVAHIHSYDFQLLELAIIYATRLEAIATRLEAIAVRLEAIATY